MDENDIAWRLGLDLGTNSIGWCAYSLDDSGKIDTLKDLGVRIFSNSRDKAGESLAVERRTARGMRRVIHRKKLRKHETFSKLRQQGLFPDDAKDIKQFEHLDPYELRVKALDEKLEPSELGRVLFHLAVRRGFKSNRKDRAENDKPNSSNGQTAKDKINQATMIKNLDTEIKRSGMRTLGEWLKSRGKKGMRFTAGRMPYYPFRKMYEAEFDAIKAKQKEYYPNVDWSAIHYAIFYQRPLRPVERGKCRYMTDKERTFKAMPCSQKLRILQEVRNMKFVDENGNMVPLTGDMQSIVIGLLDKSNKVTFTKMRKALNLDANSLFNLEYENRKDLNGNTTAVLMRKPEMFGAVWDTLSLEEQDNIIEAVITADEDKQVRDVIAKYDLSQEQLSNIPAANKKLPSGTGAYCKEFTEVLVHRMEATAENITEARAAVVESLGLEPEKSIEGLDKLPYYGEVLVGYTIGADPSVSGNDEKQYGKIANPTAHVALNQTRKVVNALIKRYGRPQETVVELARELKQSRDSKKRDQAIQAEHTKENKNDNDTLQNVFKVRPDGNNRLKYRLWMEQAFYRPGVGKCMYCGEKLTTDMLFATAAQVHIDHILPYSRTLLDTQSNKVLCCAACNEIKGNKTPYEAFGHSDRWSGIMERVSHLKDPVKRRNFAPNAIREFEKKDGFAARQLTDNAYLSRMALKYLKSVCPKVWSVNGGMTHLLREKWEINEILSSDKYKKNRQDHRHHALDAAVIAQIDPALVQEISTRNAHNRLDKIECPGMKARDEIVKKTRSIVVSFKPEHGAQGKLSKETQWGYRNFTDDNDETNKVYVARKPITSLSSEKDISDIVDRKIRNDVRQYVKAHKGDKIEKVLQDYGDAHGIKKVRCKTTNQEPVELGRVPKFFDVLDYFAAIIWRIPPYKKCEKVSYKASYIRRTDLSPDGKTILNDKKPHPAAKKLGIVHKDDCLEFLDNGCWLKCRVVKFAAGDNSLVIAPLWKATDKMSDWIRSTPDEMFDQWWKQFDKLTSPGTKKTVSVLFRDMHARFITVDPIGRVSMKK